MLHHRRSQLTVTEPTGLSRQMTCQRRKCQEQVWHAGGMRRWCAIPQGFLCNGSTFSTAGENIQATWTRTMSVCTQRGQCPPGVRSWQSRRKARQLWFGADVPALPLTAECLRAVSAMLISGNYRSAENYVSRMKDAHLENFEWTSRLAREQTPRG